MKYLLYTNEFFYLECTKFDNLPQTKRRSGIVTKKFGVDMITLVSIAHQRGKLLGKLLVITQIGFLLGLPLEGKVSRSDG